MENADALDLSKENIQPLKRGRNTAQLGLALQAQTDTALHQMLSKKQEWYEMQIRAYEGSDPLELWCDYISWVEQSFPKHGPEGNLSTLLTKCFQAFKDEEKYKNDIRFVGLWIKYIEMQSDSKRVELYQLLHTQGIGLTCAEFYRSWAYEYQSMGDWKQADLVFKKGSSHMAQPAEDFQAAHQQFLASYVFNHRNMNNEISEEMENHVQADHRLPMASLRPVGKRSAAPSVRVGSNVRSQLPGVVPAIQGSSGRSSAAPRSFGVRGNNAGPVTVYQGDAEPGVSQGPIASSALPIPQSINKENIVKAGPWSGQSLGSRKHQTLGSSHAYAQKQPGFEVHKDEDVGAASSFDLRSHGMAMPNVLQPRKGLEDGFHDAIAIFEEPNPFSKPMYRKNEVYAGGKELQLEELHAIDYFRKRSEKEKKLRESPPKNNHVEGNAFYEPKTNTPSNTMHIVEGDSNVGAIEEHPSRQPCGSNNPAISIASGMTNFHQSQPLSLYELPMGPSVSAHCSTELPQHDHPQQEHRFQPSNQSMHNQSMTLHTKLAMHEVDNLWGSPTVSKITPCEPNLPISSTANMYQPPFHIMRDESLPPQAHGNSPVQNMESQVFSQNQFCKSKMEPHGSTFGGPPHVASGFSQPKNRMDAYPSHSSDSYVTSPALYTDPMTETSYVKHHNGFQVYQEESYSPVPPRAEKFEVFCDDVENAAPTGILSGERGDLSSSGSTVEKVAKEKENIHKFPQADIELLEDCGAAPMAGAREQMGWQHQPTNNFSVGFPTFVQQVPNQHVPLMNHNLHGQIQPPSMTAHEAMLSTPSVTSLQPSPVLYHAMQSVPTCMSMQASSSNAYTITHPNNTPHGMMYGGPMQNNGLHEPMEDDATVAAAPIGGVSMSETGITESFFFPRVGAASTPYQTSPKKSRASKSSIDFNSSLYRCEQSWPDEEEGADNNRPDAPKTVPPLKLFRIKNDGDQLSAIMETSKEKYQSGISSVSSRSSMSAMTQSRFGMYTTGRQSLAPQPSLSNIEKCGEPPLQEGQNQVQGPDIKQMNEISARLANKDISPFDSRLLEYFLFKMSFPLSHHADGYFSLSGAVPTRRNNCLNLNGTLFSVNKVLGEGAYAKVLKAVNTSTQKEVALKIQKPSCIWEYYICREVQHRLSQQDLVSAFMPADQIFVYNNGSIIVTDFLQFGSLLNLINKVVAATKRPMQEPQVFYLIEQLISIVKALHDCKIIHGDLKPDNILLRAIPAVSAPCLQLIDFGRSIDMKLMPEGMTFNQIVMTDTFTCIEMRTGRPWTYQTDLFGLANTAHCLIFGDYMKVLETKSTGRWAIQSKLPRNFNSEFWCTFFDTLLNISSCDALPDIEILSADVKSCMNSCTQLQLGVSALGSMLTR